MTNTSKRMKDHCREVIRACLNIADQNGDTYVAIHKDDDVECVVLVSMIRTYPIMSVIVADKILFDKAHEAEMYRTANDLNSESVIGWHTIVLTDSSSIYMYRQCIWMDECLTRDSLFDVLCHCIAEYKHGRSVITAGQNSDAAKKTDGKRGEA
jgi:hypothetical protein